MKPSLLIVDDEPAQRRFLSAALGIHYDVVAAANGREAVDLLSSRSFDLVLTDQRMPEMSGIELIAWMQEHAPETPAIVLTAFGTIETAVEAMKRGAADYLNKPLRSPDELRIVVAKVLENRKLQNQALIRKSEAEAEFPVEIVAESAAMKQLLRLAERVAAQPTTVLLTGESGTGKEVISRFIHRRSPRADQPFVAVNCAALTESLLESELFGHEKGAFTGASKTKPGKFELAHQGTLFLDEIGAMGFELQSKLLRALQEHQFERVGGVRIIRVDVRVIAATNQDLETAIGDGSFRSDLYYRLNVFPLRLPPLRERRADILPLARHFVKKISARMGQPAKPLPAEVEELLEAYDWPGNVRELQNALERALIVSSRDRLELADLPRALKTAGEPGKPSTLADLEKQAILETLGRNDGDRQNTAKELGISLRKLQYRLKEYGVVKGNAG